MVDNVVCCPLDIGHMDGFAHISLICFVNEIFLRCGHWPPIIIIIIIAYQIY